MRRPVEIVDYDPTWPQLFKREKKLILKAIGHIAVRIEHIGSTSVSGLGAKPTIDILVAINHLSDARNCVEPLRLIGYEYQPQHEALLPERRYFRKGASPEEQHYHLHMVELKSDFWTKHLLFRDYLRAHTDVAQEYQELKKQLAVEYGVNREGYTDAKAPFIESIIARAKSESYSNTFKPCILSGSPGILS